MICNGGPVQVIYKSGALGYSASVYGAKATIQGRKKIVIGTIPTAIGQGVAQVRGLGAPTGAAPESVAKRTATDMRKRGFQSLGSGARALRK
eukprot:6208860-Pleurochrysis_carterae.AAC.5